MNRIIIVFFIFFITFKSNAQTSEYWQQRVSYFIHADMDVNEHIFNGTQKVVYHNNSPDTLFKVYFHLYFNAFQPNSMMAIKQTTILDPERKLEEKFLELKDNDKGKVVVNFLKQNGQFLNFEIFETILKAGLIEPIPPGDSAVFDLQYISQIPKLIRRSGSDSDEGIDFSMAQWYPKLVAYDSEGFHPDIYLGREFYGVWGDYDVVVDIDNQYKIAAGAKLIDTVQLANHKTRYHYIAKNVHDFVWAADRDYTNYSVQADSSTTFNFYYQNFEYRQEPWKQLGGVMKEAFSFMNKRYGRYQYDMYNFIEGGDGGMEYPLATLITGNRPLNSLVGISVHEFMHSWYHTMLATNESLYPWMDEGFTSFATIEVLQYLIAKKLIDRELPEFPFQNDYNTYVDFINSYFYEPMNIHADHYSTNYAYGVNAYVGGMIFLKQLEYIIGKESFDKGLLNYFYKWKFKNPRPIDFIRVMEKTSDLELRWYLDYFVNRAGTIDYSIDTVYEKKINTILELKNLGTTPMPVDVEVTYENGSTQMFSIPVDLMFGSKSSDEYKFEIAPVWKMVNFSYTLELNRKVKDIVKIVIDPSLRMVDVDRSNNTWFSTNQIK